MSEFDAHIQEPNDEEVPEEEDLNPCESLQPSVVDVLVQKGVLPPCSTEKGNSMRMRRKYTLKFRTWLGYQAAKEKSRLEGTFGIPSLKASNNCCLSFFWAGVG